LPGKIKQIILNFLDVSKQPQKCLYTFIYAGRFDRKLFGLHFYQTGCSKNLIISVGRFEWRKFLNFNLPVNEKLIRLVNQTPPHKRHFFVEMGPNNRSVQLVKINKLGTYGECLALLKFIRGKNIKELNVISSPWHLRRLMLVLRKFIYNSNITIVPVGSNWPVSYAHPEMRPENESLITLAIEMAKYVYYNLFLNIK